MEERQVNVVGVIFKKYGKKYYFDCHNLNLKKNLTVIVETERGLQFGTVITNIIKMQKSKIHFPLKKVIRISTKKDYTNHLNNIKDEKKAFEKCNELIKKHNLDMKLVEVSYTFERTQLFFTFISSDRVDFRELAKDLAKIYKTRIELRQIGPRDKAKEIGGLGPCGRPLCCSSYLYTFDNITINMAKNQNIALNPGKINGECNRLLCCLSYEDEVYSELKKTMPSIGQIIKKDGKEGKIISVDVFKKSYKIETKEKEIIEVFEPWK
ncbi:MAG: stage 0 sporulation protein [Bacilli bacterium]|nr:stage 0 sporulation protein [Bacilli bacterium]